MAVTLGDMAPDASRPVVVNAAVAQRLTFEGDGQEVTVLHRSWVADLLAASPRQLRAAGWHLGLGLCAGGLVAAAALALAGSFVAGVRAALGLGA